MDIFHLLSATSTVIVFSFPLFLLSLGWISKVVSRNTKRKPKPPEASGAWPVIGHLHLLGGSQPIHITLANMADKNGPIFTIKLGVRRALVVSNTETIKECLTTNDKAFATRQSSESYFLGSNVLQQHHAWFRPTWTSLASNAQVR